MPRGVWEGLSGMSCKASVEVCGSSWLEVLSVDGEGPKSG